MQHSNMTNTHDCCDEMDMANTSMASNHDCQECSQCQSSCGANCGLFLTNLVPPLKPYQHTALGVSIHLYVEPNSQDVIPPIC